jgi:hypothetical protein
MASAFHKFARGAAGTGSKLYADKAMVDHRDDLTAKRDARLNGYNEAAQQARITSAETISSDRTGALKEIASDKAAALKESPRTKLAQSNLDDKDALRDLGKQYLAAETDEEKTAIRESMGLMKGTIGKRYLSAGTRVFDMDNNKFLDPPKNTEDMRKTAAKVAGDIFKAQSEYSGEEKKTYDSIFKEVMETYGGETAAPVVDPGKAVEYKTQEDVRAAFQSGDLTRVEATKMLTDNFGFE